MLIEGGGGVPFIEVYHVLTVLRGFKVAIDSRSQLIGY